MEWTYINSNISSAYIIDDADIMENDFDCAGGFGQKQYFALDRYFCTTHDNRTHDHCCKST